MDVSPGAEQHRAPQLGGAERSGQGVLAHTHAPALAEPWGSANKCPCPRQLGLLTSAALGLLTSCSAELQPRFPRAGAAPSAGRARLSLT